MSDFKIERGVPIPDRSPRRCKYPLEDMEVGDSFVTDHRSVSSSVIWWSLKNRGGAWKFSTARQSDGTFRVWRIA